MPASIDQHPSTRMPAVFVGHGSPMNAILDNTWSRGFQELGAALPRPKAVLAVSAHWYVPGTYVTGEAQPKTIHDFGGFPEALYAVQYPAPGDPALARRVSKLVRDDAELRTDWGLDHGTWSVLRHMFPAGDVPVLQLSIDRQLPPSAHLQLGEKLAELRDEGVLLLGSGNIVHNLRHAMRYLGSTEAATPEWATHFDADVARGAAQHDHDYLARAVLTDTGKMSHPSLDHYLPLLYVAGAANAHDAVAFPISGFDASSISMRAIRFG